MAANFFARDNYDAFLDSPFDPIRRYILEGILVAPSEPVTFVFPSVELDWTPFQFSTLDHLVAYQCQGDAVDAVVVVFGHYQFKVHLGQLSVPPPRPTSSYRVNPLIGRERLDADFEILRPAFSQPWADWKAHGTVPLMESTTALLDFLTGETPTRLQRQMVAHAVEKHCIAGQVFTEAAANPIGDELVEQFLGYCHAHGILFRRPRAVAEEERTAGVGASDCD